MHIWQHSRKEKGGWSIWLHLGDGEIHFSTSWAKTFRALGFKLHIGNRGSETPIDWNLQLWFISFYGAFSAGWLRSFAEWIGHGHKRDISLRLHGGQLWWKLWWDDDGGHDRTIHHCNKWAQPKLYPWRWGRKKYRSWMCLRNGRIDLNPLDAIWGSRFFDYVTVEEDILLIEINDFPGDEYMVEFKLQEVWRQRRHGPKLWVARRTFEGHTAEWSAPGAGIPVQNHSWKGDGILASGVKVKSRDTWRMDADIALSEFIRKERERNGYHPPVGRVTNVETTDGGLYVTGEIWDSATMKAIQGNDLKHMSLGFDQTDKGVAMTAASLMEDGLIDLAARYLEFSETDSMLPIPDIKFEGHIPMPTPKDDFTVIMPTAFDKMKLESLSLDVEPNAFGESIHLVKDDGEDLTRVAEWEKENPPVTKPTDDEEN